MRLQAADRPSMCHCHATRAQRAACLLQGWWNAGDVAEYWRLWNMPVHKWLLRHVYYPCMRLGMGKWWAGTVVFAISAGFHELLIGLPLHMVKLWAFVGLMFQACLLYLSIAAP